MAERSEQPGRVAVFGSSGATGRLVVDECLARGYEVSTLVRPQSDYLPPSTTRVHRSELAIEPIRRTLQGADAVISLVGPTDAQARTLASDFARDLTATMASLELQRLIMVTGALVGQVGLGWFYQLLLSAMPAAQRELISDRQLSETRVMRSDLQWTLVRPPRLTNGPDSRAIAAGPKEPIGMLARISRTSLARFLVDQIESSRWTRQAINVIG